MKRTSFILIAVLLAMAIPMAVSAQSMTYNSGFNVQNLEGSDASIEIVFYNQDGTAAASVPDTIPANGVNKYFPLDPVQDGFSGSVVIQSDKDIRAVANILANSGTFGASYDGFQQGATTVYAPLLMKNNGGFTTWFNVQNTGANATTVNIAYSDGATNSCANLKPGASCTVNQADESHSSKVFAATLTAGEPIAVAMLEVGPTTLFAYSGFTAGSLDLAVPLVNANNAGYRTGIQIQNMGSSSTSVTLSYTPSTAGSPCQETQTIAPGASATFAFLAFWDGGVCGKVKFVGSARVSVNSANQPLVGIVNQLNSGANKGAAYEAFDPAAGTERVVMPTIFDRNAGYNTAIHIMNVGASVTHVICAFANSGVTLQADINPGTTWIKSQYNQIGDKYVGSATCTSDAGGKIVGMVNELKSSSPSDAFLVYNGFNY